MDHLQYCKIDGYRLVSSYCRTTMSGGSVAVYVREEIEARPFEITT